jgi:hypothetical protein
VSSTNQTLREGRQKAETAEGGAEEEEFDARENGGKGRIDDIPPGKVAGIVHRKQFVAMEAVLIVEKSAEQDVQRS